MKKIIIILATIILGIFISSSIINGESDSFKKSASDLGSKATSEINKFIGN